VCATTSHLLLRGPQPVEAALGGLPALAIFRREPSLQAVELRAQAGDRGPRRGALGLERRVAGQQIAADRRDVDLDLGGNVGAVRVGGVAQVDDALVDVADAVDREHAEPDRHQDDEQHGAEADDQTLADIRL